jgi:UDP-4-amino-4,6-dideoxy-N-acetyl-beta-L-altrosamine transaminase
VERLAIDGGVPVRSKLLPYGHQWIGDDDIASVVEVLKSDWITQGPKVDEFETKVAEYCGAKYAVAVSSGTAALHAACAVAGIATGDEAITTPITFVATANAIIYCGGKPVFADIKADTLNIDAGEVFKKISPKTKAILPVDFAGHPADLDEIMTIAGKKGLLVIEDASHALGAEYKGQKIGSLADMTIFSFHPVKHITTGEGGMILTDNEEFYDKLKIFRHHGIVKDNLVTVHQDVILREGSDRRIPETLRVAQGDTKRAEQLLDNLDKKGSWYYEIYNPGYNFRLTDFQCALGISQLKKLGRFIQRRREIAAKYNEAFADMEEVITPIEDKNVKAVYHIYVIQLRTEKLKVGRKEVSEALRAENIGVNVHYMPLHLHPFYQREFGCKKGDYPKAERYYDRAITLPVFPGMSDEDIEDVIKAVKKVVTYYGN